MKIKELKASLEEKRVQAKAFAEEGKTVEAKALLEDMKTIKDQIEVLEATQEEEKENIQNKAKGEKGVKTMKNVNVEAFKNFVSGKPLTGEMQNAIVTSDDGAALIPDELVTVLMEKKKQLVSLEDFITTIDVSAPSGSIPVETDTNALLVDFDELSDLNEQGLSFTSVPYAVKNRGAITPLSRVLIQDSAFGMPEIVQKNFVKKSTRTKNADIVAQLKTASKKSLTNVASLSKSINKDLDPAALLGGVIIMNQDTYDLLEGEVGTDGHPLIKASVSDENVKVFKGLQVVVLSNAELPTVATKAPVFFGSLDGIVQFRKEGIEVAADQSAGFNKNAIMYRVIERYDIKKVTEDFVYGEFTIA